MAIYVRSLTKEERAQLESWQSDPDVRASIQRRVTAVLLSDQGYRVPAAAKQVGLHPLNLRKWIHRFNCQGPEGLLDLPRCGHPPKLDPDLRGLIRKIVMIDPRILGYSFDAWTATRLMHHLRQSRLVGDCSYEWVRQLYNEAQAATKWPNVQRPARTAVPRRQRPPERALRPVFQAAGTT